MDNETIVFDFGQTAVRVLLLEGSGKGLRVRDFASAPHGRHASDEEKKSALRAALAAVKTRAGARAALTWEEGLVFRQLTLPDMPPDDLKKAFLWEMKEKFLFNGEESFYASECVAESSGEDGGRERIYNVFYCDRRAAGEKIALVEALGWKVRAVVPGQSAVAAVVGAAAVDTARDVLAFDIGHQSARVLVVRDGKNMLSRTVMLGGQTLTDMMTASFFDAQGNRVQLGPAEAEALKVSQGASDPQAAHIGLLRPYLEKIVSEIKRSVDYYEGQKYSKPIVKAVFTGGGSGLKGLASYMARFLGLEVAPLAPENFAAPSLPAEKRERFEAEFGSFVAGIGAGFDTALNLLPKQEEPGRKRFRGMSVRLVVMIAGVLLAFWDGWSYFQMRLAASQLAALTAEAKELGRISTLVSDLETQQAFMRVALKGDLSHPALLKALSRATPASMTLDRLTFRREDGSLVIEGSVESAGRGEVKVIAQFINDLLKTPFFKEASLASSTPDAAQRRLRFQVRSQTAGVL